MNSRGLSVLELVLTLAPGLLILGTFVLLMPHVHQLSRDVPRTMEARQRLWWAADRLVAAIRATQVPVPMADGLFRLSRVAPVVRILSTGEGRDGVELMAPSGHAIARLRLPTRDSGGALALEASPCVALGTVCGFSVNDVAVVVDGTGHVDVFEVVSATKAGASLRPRNPLQFAYQTGAWVVGVRVERWTTDRDTAGEWMLRRRTGAGAVETIADRLGGVQITAWAALFAPTARWVTPTRAVVSYGFPLPTATLLEGLDADALCGWRWSGTGWLSRLETWGTASVAPFPLERMTDGPWCGVAGSPAAFDADLVRLARIDVRLSDATSDAGARTISVHRTVGWQP